MAAEDRAYTARIQPTLKGKIWSFDAFGHSGERMATAIEAWLDEHPEVEVRAVIPVMDRGELRELRVVPK